VVYLNDWPVYTQHESNPLCDAIEEVVMNMKVAFLLIIGSLLLSLPVLADRPADAGVKRTQIEGYDNWAWKDNPISPGTTTCPGGELVFDPFGMPYCADSATGRLHIRDVVLWACVTSPDDPRMTGVGLFTVNGNLDADSSGPVWGKWTIVPLEGCDKDGFYPEEQVTSSTRFWHGSWQGKRLFYSDMGIPVWIGDLELVGKGNGGDIDGLHFKGTELITTYTSFPLPYEVLGIPGLYDMPEGFITGTIKE
jgi:hypothetical protein